MEARFFSDTALENFKDEAELIGFEVGHPKQWTRDVVIECDDDETLTALVHLNGGDVLRPPEQRGREGRKGKS